ncbi:MAG: hypothetical protein ACJ8R9_15115 [Steroidobacteraceae bacterium]
MQDPNKKLYYFRGDASSVGGYVEEPFETNIPTVAAVSLPPVGGFAMDRSEAFTLDDIVTCSLAYSRVSGRDHGKSIFIGVQAVVENLNILDVVTARRVVSQISIWIKDGKRKISLEGSCLEGLEVKGTDAFKGPDIRKIGWARGGILTQSTESDACLTPNAASQTGDWRPMIEGCEGPRTIIIPDFGRLTLGQLLVTKDYVQLVGIRADLGCPVKGGVTISAAGGGGAHDE